MHDGGGRKVRGERREEEEGMEGRRGRVQGVEEWGGDAMR